MNCKPGDLAVVVRGQPDVNLGRIVRVTELISDFRLWIIGTSAWKYEGEIIAINGLIAKGIDDECLRPLRDSDGVDETLEWVTPPVKETV